MFLHIAALFTHDDTGRITGVNQWNGGEAPRFFLGRTRDHVEWRVRADLPAALAASLERLCRDEVPCLDFEQPPRHRADYVRLLDRHAPIERVWAGPAYWLATDITPVGTAVHVDERTSGSLHGGLEAWLADVPHRRPFLVQIAEGHAVAVCASVRITEAAHEAGVETLPGYRRCGHGAAVVSSWAHAVRELGALPLYSTSWENAASQRLAGSLGFSLYGSDFHVT